MGDKDNSIGGKIAEDLSDAAGHVLDDIAHLFGGPSPTDNQKDSDDDD